MSRTRVFAVNTFLQAIAQVVSMLAGFIIPRVMLVAYGSEINGIVTSITQFISYFNLLEAGISGAAVFALYKPIAEKDNKKIGAILNATKKLYRQSGCFFIVFVIVLAMAYPHYIRTSLLSRYDLGVLIVVLGCNGAIEFFAQGKYKVLLTADQKYYVISISNIFYYLTNTAIILIVANCGSNIVALRIIALFSLIIRAGIIFFYCYKRYKEVDYSQKPDLTALNKRWDAFILQILGVVRSATPVVLLTIIVKDLKIVSVYSVYALIVGGVGSVIGIFTTGLTASFGDVIARGETQTLRNTYSIFETIYYLIVTVVYSSTVVLIIPFVRLYTKDIVDIEYILPITGFLFSLQGYLHDLKTPQGMLVISAGQYKETRLQTMTQGGLAVGLGVAFSYKWGLNGILIALIISEIYRLIDLVGFISKNVTKTSTRRTIIKIAYSLCIFALFCVLSFASRVAPNTYWGWIMYAFLVTILVSLLTIVVSVLTNRKETLDAFVRIKQIFRRK